jgi:hypothetical protein
MPKCDKCGELARHGRHHYREVPSSDPEGWREFVTEPMMCGCDAHMPISKTFYLDGRVVLTDSVVSEKA